MSDGDTVHIAASYCLDIVCLVCVYVCVCVCGAYCDHLHTKCIIVCGEIHALQTDCSRYGAEGFCE